MENEQYKTRFTTETPNQSAALATTNSTTDRKSPRAICSYQTRGCSIHDSILSLGSALPSQVQQNQLMRCTIPARLKL